MKRSSQRGVALVTTLIMLAVVTMMAITFLAISRRERASVQVTADQTDARLMADAALQRVQAEIVARMLASSNPFNYGLMVSTNYINPAGFVRGNTNVVNVNYDYGIDGQPLSGLDRIRNVGNLFYSPRPPVYVDTNGNGAFDFRFYLDFNRNGRFESNGFLPAVNALGYPISVGGARLTNFFVGDPEWIGVLERPELAHSGTNRFIGRYAYLVLPSGKSLDLNFIHNQAKRRAPAAEGYLRNQGFGSWELNLAAFLADLNANVWYPLASPYFYNPLATASSSGVAFDDALALLRQRYNTTYAGLASVSQLFGAAGANAFINDRIDGYADGPLMTGTVQPPAPEDNPAAPWPGADNPSSYFDAQQLFSLTNGANPILSNPLANFTSRLTTNLAATGRSSYDRYTFYRMLAQMGMDSTPSLAGKMNLNYATDFAGNATSFVPWTAIGFFTNAANLMLQASVVTNVITSVTKTGVTIYFTNYFIGDTPVRTNTISVADIQLYPINEYSSSVHRLLQVAANLYDATTNRIDRRGDTPYPYLPSVFYPVFRKTATNVSVAGFREAIDTSFLGRLQVDLSQLAAMPQGVYSNLNVYGQPVVIGAKKGYPNFNEWNSQTALRITRKLELARPNTNSLPSVTNLMYLLAITNRVGVEAWNAYTNAFSRPLFLRVINRYSLMLSNSANPPRILLFTNVTTPFGAFINPNLWRGQQFQVPISTNITILSNMVYQPASAPPFTSTAVFTPFDPRDPRTSREPQWSVFVTNRLVYYLLDESNASVPRVVDYASLVSVQQETNVMQRLRERLRTHPMANFWLLDTNGTILPGVTNQILASKGLLPLDNTMWRDANNNLAMGADKTKSTAFFQYFAERRTTGANQLYELEVRSKASSSLREQTPFNPSPILFLTDRRQANDPLVHYMLADLRPGAGTNAWPADPVPVFILGQTNRSQNAYSPWGAPFALFPGISISPVDPAFKDPMVRRMDDWDFPIGKFPNVGWIGRVHRGTPWQTLYLKSPVADPRNWLNWSGSLGTHPTNDWRLMDLFTVAPNANAARGLLSVNQTNLAAWSAVLSGVNVLGNNFIQPNSANLSQIVGGINRTRDSLPLQTFQHMGDVLATPELTANSPFLNLLAVSNRTDVAYERIPQQILSLLKPDEPRMVIYAFGQSLKPADHSLVLLPGANFRLCTNYQITAEFVTRTVLRIDGGLNNPRAVVESYSILPAD
ncbi:MAG: hypothetical protein ACYDH9_18140 [Limisphaerales bacterium]